MLNYRLYNKKDIINRINVLDAAIYDNIRELDINVNDWIKIYHKLDDIKNIINK